MEKKVVMFVKSFFTIMFIFLISCSTQGPQGPEGPKGEDGVGAKVYDVRFTWEYDSFGTSDDLPYIQDNDIVLVYLVESLGVGYDEYIALPCYSSTYEATFSYFNMNYVGIRATDANNKYKKITKANKFRVIIIPCKVASAASKTIDFTNYQQVSSEFGLDNKD
ncbi:MAG: hypothetical protein EOL95_06670 [Bacteroidia bacterium]|nr:hypothetical protein [Bacteroidia bacterium]